MCAGTGTGVSRAFGTCCKTRSCIVPYLIQNTHVRSSIDVSTPMIRRIVSQAETVSQQLGEILACQTALQAVTWILQARSKFLPMLPPTQAARRAPRPYQRRCKRYMSVRPTDVIIQTTPRQHRAPPVPLLQYQPSALPPQSLPSPCFPSASTFPAAYSSP